MLRPTTPELSARAPTSRAEAAAAMLRPVRAYLRAADIPPAGIGAYGVFAFHGRPTPPEMERFTMACNSFIAYLTKQSSLPPSIGPGDQMLTIWPLDQPQAPEALADDCDFLLAHYDLFAAEEAMRDAGRQGADFHGGGPFLIGWSPADTRGTPDKLVMVVDMSGYDTQDRFNHGFQFWKDKIIDRPELFRRGWDLEGVRQAIRDFADRYGTDILQAAHLTSGPSK